MHDHSGSTDFLVQGIPAGFWKPWDSSNFPPTSALHLIPITDRAKVQLAAFTFTGSNDQVTREAFKLGVGQVSKVSREKFDFAHKLEVKDNADFRTAVQEQSLRLASSLDLYSALVQLSSDAPRDWQEMRECLEDKVWQYLLSQLQMPLDQQHQAVRSLLAWLIVATEGIISATPGGWFYFPISDIQAVLVSTKIARWRNALFFDAYFLAASCIFEFVAEFLDHAAQFISFGKIFAVARCLALVN